MLSTLQRGGPSGSSRQPTTTTVPPTTTMIGRGAYIPASGTSCSGGFWSYGGGCIPCSLNPSQCGSPAVMPTPAPRVTTTTTIAPSRSCSPGYFYYLADRGSGCAVCPSVWSASIPFPSECSGYTRRKSVPTTTTTTSPPPPATLPPCPSGVVRYGCVPTTTTTTTTQPQITAEQKRRAERAFLGAVMALCRSGKTTGIPNIDNGTWCRLLTSTTTTTTVVPLSENVSQTFHQSEGQLGMPRHTKLDGRLLVHSLVATSSGRLPICSPDLDPRTECEIPERDDRHLGQLAWDTLKEVGKGVFRFLGNVWKAGNDALETYGDNLTKRSEAYLAMAQNPIVVSIYCVTLGVAGLIPAPIWAQAAWFVAGSGCGIGATAYFELRSDGRIYSLRGL